MTYEEAISTVERIKINGVISEQFTFLKNGSVTERSITKLPEKGINVLDMAIKAMELQVAKKPYKDNENGVYEKDYCPNCHRSLFPYEHHCKCGQKLDWSEE